MAEGIIQVLLRPDEFFGERAGDEPSLGIPLAIVFIYGILSAVVGYQMAALMAPMYASVTEGFGGIIAVIGGVGGFITAFLMWIVGSIIFYLISMIFNGEGSMKKVLEAVGYGMTPLIASVGVALIYLSMIADQVVVPVIRDFSDPTAIETALESFMNQPVMAEFTLLQTVLSIIFIIWAANIWYSGIRHARRLSSRDAAITVFVPIALYLIVTIISYGVL